MGPSMAGLGDLLNARLTVAWPGGYGWRDVRHPARQPSDRPAAPGRTGGVMLPLSDGMPARRFPVVNVLLIVIGEFGR